MIFPISFGQNCNHLSMIKQCVYYYYNHYHLLIILQHWWWRFCSLLGKSAESRFRVRSSVSSASSSFCVTVGVWVDAGERGGNGAHLRDKIHTVQGPVL